MSGSTDSRRRILMVAPQRFFRTTGTPMNVLLKCRAVTESGFGIHLLTLPRGDDLVLSGLVRHPVARLPGIGFSGAKLLYNLVVAVEMQRLRRRAEARRTFAMFKCQLLSAYQTILGDGRPEAATVATGGPPIHG